MLQDEPDHLGILLTAHAALDFTRDLDLWRRIASTQTESSALSNPSLIHTPYVPERGGYSSARLGQIGRSIQESVARRVVLQEIGIPGSDHGQLSSFAVVRRSQSGRRGEAQG